MRVPKPTSGSPAWGLCWKEKHPEHWRPAGLKCRSSTGLGEKETPLLEGAYMISHALVPGQSRDSIRILARPTNRHWRVSQGGRGWLWLTVEEGNWRWRSQGLIIGVSLPGGCRLGKIWPHPTTAYSHECWKAQGQITSKVGTETHPAAERLPKVFLGIQPPLITPLNMALITRRMSYSSTHWWVGRHQSLTAWSCQKPLGQLHPLRAVTRSKRNYNLVAYIKENTKIDKVKQQRNTLQRNKTKPPEQQLREVEIGSLHENLHDDRKDDPRSWKQMEAKTKKLQELFNKEREDLKKRWIITEMKKYARRNQ